MKASQVATRGDLAVYITQHKNTIYVREQVNGKWGSYALTELPADLALDHALKFIEEGRIPVCLKEEI